MNTHNEIEYIRRQYIKQGLLNADGAKIPLAFDYNTYPWEGGYIPKCTVCSEMYNKWMNGDKAKKITAPHKGCGCLWFEWFQQKILTVNSEITFTDK